MLGRSGRDGSFARTWRCLPSGISRIAIEASGRETLNGVPTLAASAVLCLGAVCRNAALISPGNTANHIAETATVCGAVELTNFDAGHQQLAW